MNIVRLDKVPLLSVRNYACGIRNWGTMCES